MVLFDDDVSGDGRSVSDHCTGIGDEIFDAVTVLEQLEARLDDLCGEYDRGDLVSVCVYCFNRVPYDGERFSNYCVSCGTGIGSVFLISLDDATIVRVEDTV